MTDFYKNYLSAEKSVAILTWLVVSVNSLQMFVSEDGIAWREIVVPLSLLLIYIVAFIFAVRETDYKHDDETRLTFVLLSFACCVALYFVLPVIYIAILMVIWSAVLPHFMGLRGAILISPFLASIHYLVYTYYWEMNFVLTNSILFWTFNLFALGMVGMAQREEKAREKAEQLNRELLATQALLSEAGKQAERVRIARNIHDLLGHHLTAMTINLQVASRISNGQVKEKVDECHGLAKLLLSDVREAVSEIREKSTIQLRGAIEGIIKHVPKLDVQLDYDETVVIDNVDVADAIIKCVQESITNSLKHSHASSFSVSISNHHNAIEVVLKDNGGSHKAFVQGNGLTGVIERMKAISGTASFEMQANGFLTTLMIPREV
ncbi:histidine kinase [Aestuariibacter sp. AA17]|uniref:Histidine kinase n=1 Tax=Fluctibacter corallii TaxID=2984329 RepID=A0ABT3A4G7_9ALTE|nr:histidine kinase [Aestuariibacter sp. AA17]MCV2883487.1 histidine kinase [Aestuariibacter sp. AA17]